MHRNQTSCKPVLAVLATLALLGGSTPGAQAGVFVHVACTATVNGICPPPPAPPAPPPPPAPPAPSAIQAPPAPPAPPAGRRARHAPALPALPAPPALPAMPAIPALPAMPPAPPAPPPLPEVPEAAHAACAGKPEGSRLTHVLGKDETMDGVCGRAGGRPVFQLHTYRRG